MNERYKLIAWIAINNTIRFLGIAYLAWSFQHWWIVLFSPLFFNSVRLNPENKEVARERE